LADRAALWNAKPENRYLPASWEYVNIRALTTRKNWTEPQQKMMRRAGWYHAVRTTALALLLGFLAWAGWESYSFGRAVALVRALSTAEISGVPEIVGDLHPFRRWADRRLVARINDTDEHSKEHLHASLALLPVDPSQVEYLKGRLLAATPGQLPVLREALRPHNGQLRKDLWRVLEKPVGDERKQTLQAAGALAEYDPTSKRWKGVANRIVDDLVSVSSVYLGQWIEILHSARDHLVVPLSSV
jgi:hypothetical protein